eukprot:1156162-Pelagomonas_calceolata.AAC.1
MPFSSQCSLPPPNSSNLQHLVNCIEGRAQRCKCFPHLNAVCHHVRMGDAPSQRPCLGHADEARQVQDLALQVFACTRGMVGMRIRRAKLRIKCLPERK